MSTRFERKDKIFIGTIVLVHVVFFLLACKFTRIYMGDSFEYIYEALNIKQYNFFYSGNAAMPIETEYMTQRQPLYPLFLLSVYMFTVNNWIVIVLQNLLSVFNIIYARKVFARIGYNKKYDWVLLLLIICYPSQFINANTIAPDILLQTFTLLYFGMFVQWLQTRQLKFGIWMSLALVAGLMVKPVLYPFVLPHILIVIVVAIHQKIKMQRPILIALIPLCAVLAYNEMNLERTGQFHFSSNQAFNAGYYFFPYISKHYSPDSAKKFWFDERAKYLAIEDYPERYQYGNRRGMQLLKQNFVPYMLFHLSNSLRIFIEPGKAEIDIFTGKLTYGKLYSKRQEGFYVALKKNGIMGMGPYISDNKSLFVVFIVFLVCLWRLTGFIRFFFRHEVHWLIRSFVLGLVVYFAIATGTIANTRYFLPVSLIVIGSAVIGFTGVKKETA
jgi:hypothetical protein